MMAWKKKLNLHRLPELQGYDVVGWVDGTVEITNPRCAELCVQAILAGKNILAFEHEVRQGVLMSEVNDSHFVRYTSTFWNGQPQPYQDVDEQYRMYTHEGFTEGWARSRAHQPSPCLGVWVTCFVVFNMRDPVSHAFLDEWWLQNLHTTQGSPT